AAPRAARARARRSSRSWLLWSWSSWSSWSASAAATCRGMLVIHLRPRSAGAARTVRCEFDALEQLFELYASRIGSQAVQVAGSNVCAESGAGVGQMAE